MIPEPIVNEPNDSDSLTEMLDIDAILKASQAISGEIIMDQLVGQLLSIVLESTGAERGLLLYPDGDDWRVNAAGALDDGEISLNISPVDSSAYHWSSGVVSYVNHSRAYFVSGYAQQDSRLAGDKYIAEQAIKSVLCVPILQQKELAAILYLENNLISEGFTGKRVLLVQALATQAAIALKNASLYSNVVKENSERREAESALRIITSGTASVTGRDFFRSLVQSLAASMQVKRIFVAECIGSDRRWVRTLAFMVDGHFKENIEFELAGTPCEAVVQGSACYHPDNLEKLYPREKGYESYIGAPALNLSGRVLGHLAIFDTTDMRHLPHAQSIIQIFATRVGVELHRKRTQEALQASEEKYRLLVENQTDMVIKLDQYGHLQFASPSYCEMFSRSESDLQGSSFHSQVHGQDRERIDLEWKKLSVTPWTVQFEHRVTGATGERWLGWALKALRNDNGEVIEVVGVGRDVTDRRQAEEQARQHLQTLAHAGRMQSMGEMASTLAHELNQPLTAILSFSQASQRVIQNKEYDPDDLENALDRIAVNAKRAGDIISHMRSFIGKEETHTECVDINRIIREAIDLVNSELVKREIRIVLNQQESLPDVSIDSIHIQQVILNLVRNSIEAIEQHAGNERCITITTKMQKPGGIQVIVTDTGPGLDPKIADNVFSTFATTKKDGMGVGLSICKSIVEAHGGELEVSQVPDSGAIFSFVLPTFANNNGR